MRFACVVAKSLSQCPVFWNDGAKNGRQYIKIKHLWHKHIFAVMELQTRVSR
jgi:hypothetical protein